MLQKLEEKTMYKNMWLWMSVRNPLDFKIIEGVIGIFFYPRPMVKYFLFKSKGSCNCHIYVDWREGATCGCDIDCGCLYGIPSITRVMRSFVRFQHQKPEEKSRFIEVKIEIDQQYARIEKVKKEA